MVIISTAWVAYRSQTNRPNYWDLGRCKYFVFKITQSKMSQRTFSPSQTKGVTAFLSDANCPDPFCSTS